jgi:hypothetical protein
VIGESGRLGCTRISPTILVFVAHSLSDRTPAERAENRASRFPSLKKTASLWGNPESRVVIPLSAGHANIPTDEVPQHLLMCVVHSLIVPPELLPKSRTNDRGQTGKKKMRSLPLGGHVMTDVSCLSAD